MSAKKYFLTAQQLRISRVGKPQAQSVPSQDREAFKIIIFQDISCWARKCRGKHRNLPVSHVSKNPPLQHPKSAGRKITCNLQEGFSSLHLQHGTIWERHLEPSLRSQICRDLSQGEKTYKDLSLTTLYLFFSMAEACHKPREVLEDSFSCIVTAAVLLSHPSFLYPH